MKSSVALIVIALAGCGQRDGWPPPQPPAAPGHAASDAVQALPAGPATVVVTLAHQVPTAVLRGPFLVLAINPGTEMYLTLAVRACDEPGLRWFFYSGGGVAAAAGQILCAQSVFGSPHIQGFSGRSESAAPVALPGPAAPAAPAAP